jgi:hypothetical protein
MRTGEAIARPARPRAASDARLTGLAALVLVLLSFAAYAPALGNGFYNDDALFLNHAARVLDDPGALLSERPLGYLRPVWSAWFAALYALSGLDAFGHHLAGLLLHAATAFLVFRVAHRLLGDAACALAAGAFFAVSYAHSEAGLWISAHNSSLVCAFALAALLSHLRALDSDSTRDAAVTALCVVLMLLTKEPGIVATVWLPLAEWRLRGLRACFGRRSLVRYGLVAAAGLVYLSINSRLLADAFAPAGGAATQELRSTLGFVTIERLLGTTPWLYSAARHVGDDLVPWLGAATFAGAIALAAAWSRQRLGDVLLASAMLLTALAPSCSTRLVQFNGSRLYYFPTVGAALLLGAIGAVLSDRAARSAGLRQFRFALAALMAVLATIHASAIQRRNHVDYGPISRAQTRVARSLREVLADPDVHEVHLLESWLDNSMHAREFLACFAHVPREAVSAFDLPRDEAAAWLERQRGRPGTPVLDCDETGRLFPATAIPNTRHSAQNTSRAGDSGIASPTVRVLSIRTRGD